MKRLTLQFLQDLVSQTEPDVTISSFKVSEGACRGDNYNSILYRVTLTGRAPGVDSEWHRSIIYKQLPDSLAQIQLFGSDVLFRNEVAFYKEALTTLLEFQSCTGTKEVFSAAPKCLLAEEDLLVLEDLKERGFVMADRRGTLDYPHCVAIFRELAKFHALSLAMKSQDPVGFQEKVASRVQEIFFPDKPHTFFKDNYNVMATKALKAVEYTLEDAEKEIYLNKFKEFLDKESFFKRMDGFIQGKEPLAVLCHGDIWSNNIMFRYDADGIIQEVCFIDFQNVRYSSPALDLVYLLSISVTREVRMAHTDNLLAEYSSALSAALRAMCCHSNNSALLYCAMDNIPQLIEEEVRSHKLFGLGLALEMIPVVTCDSNNTPDLYSHDDVTNVTVFDTEYEYNQECCHRMTDVLRELVDQGHL